METAIESPQHPRPRLWRDFTAEGLRNDTPARGAQSKSRLWLDSSSDHTSRSIPQLDKTQSQTRTKISDQRRERPSSDQATRSSRPSQTQPEKPGRAQDNHDNGSREEDYASIDDYNNLDEIAAPSPVDIYEQRRQGYLEDEDRDAKSPTSDNLNEVAAPSPIDSLEWQPEQRRLEDRDNESRSHSLDEKAEEEEVSPRRQRVSRLATEIYTISYLVFFSIIGTLARLGLQALTFYPGAPVQTGVLWANVGGSLIMGFLSEDRQLFQEEWGTPSSSKKTRGHDEEDGKRLRRTPSAAQRHAAIKKTLPLYIGLSTGFCGSFTSFSSFMRDCFFALSNALHVPISHPSASPISPTLNVHRNPGYSFMAASAVLIITIGLSLGALQFGAHLALGLEPFTPSIPYLFSRKVIDRSFVFIAFGCWLGAIFMAIWPPDRPSGPVGKVSWAQEAWRSQASFALVFAPLGCLLRFYASLHLNGRIKSFPLGTFAVNVFGTMMEAIFLNLQHVPVGGMIGCQVLQGMSDGFCGCLTTVSTWVAELKALKLRHAYIYGLTSVGVGLGLMVVIVGSLQWTVGFKNVACMT